MFLEGATNNHQWRRVFALASLVISLSSQPAEAPVARWAGICTARAAYEATTRDGSVILVQKIIFILVFISFGINRFSSSFSSVGSTYHFSFSLDRKSTR